MTKLSLSKKQIELLTVATSKLIEELKDTLLDDIPTTTAEINELTLISKDRLYADITDLRDDIQSKVDKLLELTVMLEKLKHS